MTVEQTGPLNMQDVARAINLNFTLYLSCERRDIPLRHQSVHIVLVKRTYLFWVDRFVQNLFQMSDQVLV